MKLKTGKQQKKSTILYKISKLLLGGGKKENWC